MEKDIPHIDYSVSDNIDSWQSMLVNSAHWNYNYLEAKFEKFVLRQLLLEEQR